MEQVAVVKNLRIVQLPIVECLYAVPSVANLPFSPFVPIAEQMRAQATWIELPVEITLNEVAGSGDRDMETQVTDPLLALAGTLKCNLPDAKPTPVPEMRVKESSLPQEVRDTDPLLALAGTLECDVTDISERHDEYIVDTLVAELQGNDDE